MLKLQSWHGHKGKSLQPLFLVQPFSGKQTVVLVQVDEPSNYGVVITQEETGRVERFVEMPRTFVVYKINAGIYLLEQHHCAHDVIGSASAGFTGYCNVWMQS